MGGALRIATGIVLFLVVLWWGLALHFRVSGPPWLGTAIGLGYALAVLVVLVRLRPFWRALAVVLASFAVLLVWWSTIRPSNDLDWAPEYAHIPYGELKGDRLVMHNIRDFDYHTETDFTPHWEDRTYDLSRLRELDLFMSYWGSPWIAHTILSWVFDDGPPLAISIETRRTRTQQYSAIKGFFREYEICYVAADERDLIALRTNYRGEQVYLYRLRIPPQQARAILLDYLRSMNELVKAPAWYNALTDNCTTSIRTHLKHLHTAGPLDWRIFANGYGDQMLYERGLVDTRVPFEELRAQCLIVPKAKAGGDGPGFSARIRDGVPRP